MSVSETLKLIQDSDAKFVDFRFTDTKGKEQHVSVPASTVDEDSFEDFEQDEVQGTQLHQ